MPIVPGGGHVVFYGSGSTITSNLSAQNPSGSFISASWPGIGYFTASGVFPIYTFSPPANEVFFGLDKVSSVTASYIASGFGGSGVGGLTGMPCYNALSAPSRRLTYKGTTKGVGDQKATNYLAAKIIGNRAYSVGFNKFEIHDISNLAAPVLVGAWISGSASGSQGGLDISSSYAFIGDTDLGFSGLGFIRVIDFSTETAPKEVAYTRISTNDNAFQLSSVCISGSEAYVVEKGGGITRVNISTPTAPTVIYHISGAASVEQLGLPGGLPPYNCYASGGYAYYQTDPATSNGTFGIVNTQYAASMSFVTGVGTDNGLFAPGGGLLTYGGGNYNMDIVDGYAYILGGVSAGAFGPWVIDVTTPNSPNVLSFYTTDLHTATSIAKIDNQLYYYTDGRISTIGSPLTGSIYIFDVSNKNNLALCGFVSCSTAQYTASIAPMGGGIMVKSGSSLYVYQTDSV